MTFDDIVAEVADRLNLTSDEAIARIGRNVNSRYRRITSSIGLETSRRIETSVAVTIGNRYVTFPDVEKLIAVIDRTTAPPDIVLSQITFDEMHITPLRSDPPRHYAVTRMGSSSVDIYLDCIPATAYTLYADAHTTTITLQGDDEPEFPNSFHDVLVFGAMSDEYRKMEKESYFHAAEMDYERRLSDLRMWIAKSAYLDITQGRFSGRNFRWTRDASLGWDQ